MMNKYGKRSKEVLATLHPDLQRVFMVVLDTIDHSLLSGHRDKEEQNELFTAGRSKLPFPGSDHNEDPSKAVDAAPYPYPVFNHIDLRIAEYEYRRMYYFAGMVIMAGKLMGVEIYWGGDWNKNNIFVDQKWDDLFHFGLILEK